MKRRTIASIFILAMTLLSSCNKKEIRSDIAEFIASFSVESAVEAYKKVEMTKTIKVDNLGDKTYTLETINFDVSDPYNPIYHDHSETYKNDVLSETNDTYFKIENEEYFIVINKVEYEYTLEKCHDIIRLFFYKRVILDGTYHEPGYYYGDMIKGSIYEYQKYMEINSENNTLKFNYCYNQRAGTGENVKRCSTFIVDDLGMLNYNLASDTAEGKSVETEIVISKKL